MTASAQLGALLHPATTHPWPELLPPYPYGAGAPPTPASRPRWSSSCRLTSPSTGHAGAPGAVRARPRGCDRRRSCRGDANGRGHLGRAGGVGQVLAVEDGVGAGLLDGRGAPCARTGPQRLDLAAYPGEVRQRGVALADQLRERRPDRLLGRTGGRTRRGRASSSARAAAWALPRISPASFSAARTMACRQSMKAPTTSGLSPPGGRPSGRGRRVGGGRAPGGPGEARTAWLRAESRRLRRTLKRWCNRERCSSTCRRS